MSISVCSKNKRRLKVDSGHKNMSNVQEKVEEFKTALSEVLDRDPSERSAEDFASLAFAAASLEFVMKGLNDEDTIEVKELLSHIRPVLEAAQKATRLM